MSAVCPSCGVAVVPGYVKCPKCHAALPKKRPAVAGGTSVDGAPGLPLGAIAAAVGLVVVIVLVFALRGGGEDDEPEAPPEPTVEPARPQPPAPAQTPWTSGQPAPLSQPTTQAGPDPRAAATDLELSLRRQRLWSKIELDGARIDVRSAACDEPAMRQTIDGAVGSLRGVGLTRLRCLAQSGAVVFERDL